MGVRRRTIEHLFAGTSSALRCTRTIIGGYLLQSLYRCSRAFGKRSGAAGVFNGERSTEVFVFLGLWQEVLAGPKCLEESIGVPVVIVEMETGAKMIVAM